MQVKFNISKSNLELLSYDTYCIWNKYTFMKFTYHESFDKFITKSVKSCDISIDEIYELVSGAIELRELWLSSEFDPTRKYHSMLTTMIESSGYLNKCVCVTNEGLVTINRFHHSGQHIFRDYDLSEHTEVTIIKRKCK